MDSKRQLAAVMFTDIVGYSALMGKDTDRALELLHQNRTIQRSLIEKQNGVWIKEIGDGIMAQFHSAVDAVKCAIQIQQIAGTQLSEKLRIGIHLGDITIENQDIYGDGVNVAARLESMAQPRGILISDGMANAIRGQKDIKVKYHTIPTESNELGIVDPRIYLYTPEKYRLA